MQTQNGNFSIVVPLFNEEENVDLLVETILTTVGANKEFMEVILVDDGSYDATASLASTLASKDDRIRLVQHEKNRGLGAAICTGLDEARGEYVLYTDADLPFDFSLIPQLIALSNENCVVTGYRLNRGEGVRRWILTKGYNTLVWLLFGLSLHDVNFACKIFPRKFLQRAEFRSDGSFIDVEILLETRRLGLKILEYPLVYYPRERGLSTLSRPGVILSILKEMFACTAQRFMNPSVLGSFIKESPLAKHALFLTAVSASMILVSQGFNFSRSVEWISLTMGVSSASILVGWRTGLLTAISTLGGLELWLFFQNQSILSQENVYFLVWPLLAFLFSQLGLSGWKIIQRLLRSDTSQWAKN